MLQKPWGDVHSKSLRGKETCRAWSHSWGEREARERRREKLLNSRKETSQDTLSIY